MNRWECIAEVMRLIPPKRRATVAMFGIVAFIVVITLPVTVGSKAAAAMMSLFS